MTHRADFECTAKTARMLGAVPVVRFREKSLGLTGFLLSRGCVAIRTEEGIFEWPLQKMEA